MKSNNVTTTGVSRVPQPPKKTPAAKYGVGDDVNAQPGGQSSSITTNYPSRTVPNTPDKGTPGAENKGNTTRDYAQLSGGFDPQVHDATVSSDGRQRVKTISPQYDDASSPDAPDPGGRF